MAGKTSPEPPWLTFAGILRKGCMDFVAAWQQKDPIWKPLKSLPLLQTACSQKTGGEVTPTTSWGFPVGLAAPPCLCRSTLGPHRPPGSAQRGPCLLHITELVPDTSLTTWVHSSLPQEALRKHLLAFWGELLNSCEHTHQPLCVSLFWFRPASLFAMLSLFILSGLEEYLGLGEPSLLFHIMQN